MSNRSYTDITDITSELKAIKKDYELHQPVSQKPADILVQPDLILDDLTEEELQPVQSQPDTISVEDGVTLAAPIETRVKEKNKKRKKKEYPNRMSWYTKLLILGDIIAIICFYIFYGPMDAVRDWFVTTAMTTGTHKYLAYILYGEQEITSILSNNAFITVPGETDASQIKFVENPDTGYYKNEYDKQIVHKDSEDQRYKIIEFDEDGCKGYIAVIYYPENLDLVMSSGSYGNTMSEFAEQYKASVAINAGGHYLYGDNTISPMGSIITNGKVRYNSSKNKMICMTKDNVLLLHKGTAAQAVKKGARWGFWFTPFLIINGVSAKYSGNGGLGVRPRTAIGQRADGIVLLVCIDGTSGASMPQLIRIFERYGCINAANLDGGGSSMMYVDGKIINNPAGWGYSGERYVINALVYK